MAGIPEGEILLSIHNPRDDEAKINEAFHTINDPFSLFIIINYYLFVIYLFFIYFL